MAKEREMGRWINGRGMDRGDGRLWGGGTESMGKLMGGEIGGDGGWWWETEEVGRRRARKERGERWGVKVKWLRGRQSMSPPTEGHTPQNYTHPSVCCCYGARRPVGRARNRPRRLNKYPVIADMCDGTSYMPCLQKHWYLLCPQLH